MAKENKLDSELVNLNLSTIKHSKFKPVLDKLRLDVEREVAGSDTLYRLMPVVRERATSKKSPKARAKSPRGKQNTGRRSVQVESPDSENEVESEEDYGDKSSSSEDEEWGRKSKTNAKRGKKRKAQSDPEIQPVRREAVRQNSNESSLQNGADENIDEDEAAGIPFLNQDQQQLSPPTYQNPQHETQPQPPSPQVSSRTGGFGGLFPEDDTDDEDVSLKEEIKMKQKIIDDLTVS